MSNVAEITNEQYEQMLELGRQLTPLISEGNPKVETVAQQLLQMGTQLNFPPAVVEAYTALASFHMHKHADFVKALDFANRAVAASEHTPTDFHKTSAYYQVAACYQRFHRYAESLSWLHECERLLETLPPTDHQYWMQRSGVAYTTGIIYNRLSFYSLSNDYMRQSLEYAERAEHRLLMRRARISMANFVRLKGDYAKALKMYEALQPEFDVTPNNDAKALINLYQAICHFELRNYESAEAFARRSVEIRESFGAEANLLDSYRLMVMILAAQGRKEEAQHYFAKAESVMQRFPHNFTPHQLNNIYSDMHGALGNYEQAFYHFKKMNVSAAEPELIEDTLRAIFNKEHSKQSAVRVEADELKHINEQMREHSRTLELSNKDLKNYAQATSHDLREPLRMVSAYMTILEERLNTKLDDNEKQFLRFAVDGTKRMDDMITRLLTAAKNQRANSQPVNLNNTMLQVKQNLAQLMRDSNATLESEALPTVLADDIQMLQLFQNLVSNAFKYNTSTAPEVKISCTQQENSIVISIADNGVGIPAAAREKVFNMFERIENASGAEGTGIGLSTCKNIVEKMRGKIWVEENLPQGTIFKVELPKY